MSGGRHPTAKRSSSRPVLAALGAGRAIACPGRFLGAGDQAARGDAIWHAWEAGDAAQHGVSNLRGQTGSVSALPFAEETFDAEVPALPGCVSEGDTMEEGLTNIRAAAEGWLSVVAERVAAAAPAHVVEIYVAEETS